MTLIPEQLLILLDQIREHPEKFCGVGRHVKWCDLAEHITEANAGLNFMHRYLVRRALRRARKQHTLNMITELVVKGSDAPGKGAEAGYTVQQYGRRFTITAGGGGGGSGIMGSNGSNGDNPK